MIAMENCGSNCSDNVCRLWQCLQWQCVQVLMMVKVCAGCDNSNNDFEF